VRPGLVARTASPFAAELLAGPRQQGVGLGHGYVLVGEQVLALTPPGAGRMPNGLETDLLVPTGEPVAVEAGALHSPGGTVVVGPLWDPHPRPRFVVTLSPRPKLRLDELPGRGPGLTPLGDDILIGYLAAAALAGAGGTALALAARYGRRTTALSRTLLRLAARGCLPEPAHDLLVDGNPGPLLRFGASSGRGIALGLALFGSANSPGQRLGQICIGASRFDLVSADAPGRPLDSSRRYARSLVEGAERVEDDADVDPFLEQRALDRR
jgi:hypothetical protein